MKEVFFGSNSHWVTCVLDAINLRHYHRIIIIIIINVIQRRFYTRTNTQFNSRDRTDERTGHRVQSEHSLSITFTLTHSKTHAHKLTILSTKIVVTRYTFQTDWNQFAAPVNSGWCWHFLEDATRRWATLFYKHTIIVIIIIITIPNQFISICKCIIWIFCG